MTVQLMNSFEIQHGSSAVVLSMPHTGEYIPEDILDKFTVNGRELVDTDWNIHRLYENLLPDATVVRALFHRYVIDPNRDPGGTALYAGRNESSLCPLYSFDGQPIYKSGQHPDEVEITRRIKLFHQPYHEAVKQSLDDALRRHGIAIVYDCHSIRSVIPNLIDSKLPDLNIGTYDGRSCDRRIEDLVHQLCKDSRNYSTVLNGMFRGGWITRHYGKPTSGIHAIQMELAQSTYMIEKPPWTMNEKKTMELRELLAKILQSIEQMIISMSTLKVEVN